MKKIDRRLTLSRTTVAKLDTRQLKAANGGVYLTGCLGGCNSYDKVGCDSESCYFCV